MEPIPAANAAAQLRKLLAAPVLVRAPGVFDGLSAHLVRAAGFGAAYLTGAGVAVSGYGVPDIGLVTASEMADRAAMIVEASGLPVIADADTGYGNALNVTRTVHSYERAGVAAIQLEDQVFPKRCGHLAGKEVISAAEFTGKLRAALDARRAETVIIARTDARAPAGIGEAIDRASQYAAAGADVIFVEAPQTRQEIERIAAEVKAPLLFNVVPGGHSPEISDEDLESLGFRLAIYPGALLGPVASAMAETLAAMGGRDPRQSASGTAVGPAGIFGLVGLADWLRLSERYG
jgi:2-methylisocitrate lyase-like PEP mutase family enzyme